MTEREKRDVKQLGEHIKKVRKSLGYSQDKLYLEAGFSRGTMSRIEAGNVNPTYLTLLKIARTLGKKVSDLLP